MRSLLCLWTSVVALSSARAGERVTLVERGAARAVIVVARRASKAETTAAREMQRILYKMSGARLDIVTAPGRRPAALIGRAAREALGEDAFSNLAFGAYRILTADRALFIAGRTDAGSAHGVYGFLQDCLGVRWFMPSELFETVPRRADIIVDVNETRAPDFACRRFSGLDGPNQEAWRRHLRLSPPGDWRVPYSAGVAHWLYRVYPGGLYGRTHPEIYPLLYGARARPPGDRQPAWQPCTSNPETIRFAVRTIRQAFAAHPAWSGYSLAINDNSNWCRCPACRALDLDRTFRGGRVYSDRYYAFVNAAARAVGRSHPGKFVGCLAYASVLAPPARIARLEPNVFVCVTQDTSQYYDADYKRRDYELLARWLAKCGRMGKYDYSSIGALAPRYYPHLLAADLRHSKRIGLVSLYSEAYPYWPCFGPHTYVYARMAWDADLDEDALLSEMFHQLFGPAAEDMAAFYDTLEKAWLTPRPPRWFQAISSIREQLELFPPAVEAKLRRCLAAAARRAPAGVIRRRVAYVERGFRYPALLMRGWRLAEAVERATRPEDAAARALELAETMNQEPARWRESMANDPNLPAFYRNDMRRNLRRQWRARCEQALAGALLRLGSGKRGAAARRLFERLIDAAGDSPRAWILRAYRGDFDRLPNLVKNPGFEQTKGAPGPKGPDWARDAALPGWSVWKADPARGRIWRDTRRVHSGKRAAALTGGLRMCYLTHIPARERARYIAWVYAYAEDLRSRVTLEIRWRDKRGAWHRGDRNIAIELAVPGRWTRLVTTFVPPPGARAIVFMLIAYNLREGSTVWFDDAFVARVKG